jgi:hypothetical protein
VRHIGRSPVSGWHGLPTLARYRGCLSRSAVFYLTAWIDPFIWAGTVVNLQTQTPPDYDDYQQHFVVPNGCIDCPGLEPYVGFINWCQNSNIDLFVFGWVWRLSSEATANFFLNRFLPAFDSLATSAGCSPHPLDNFWLVGHSFGGMVVKQISVDQSVRPKNKTRDYRRLAILRLWRTGAQIFQG